MVYSGQIASIRDFRYTVLDKIFSYIVAQILYESIENKPFLYELSKEDERVLKVVKYYISKSYRSYKEFINDYLNCLVRDMERKMTDNTGIISLRDLENKIEKSLQN